MSEELEKTPFFDVYVIEDLMRADIVFHTPSGACDTMSFSDVIDTIQKQGIVQGRRDDIIEKVLLLNLYERKVSFAYGKPAEEGKNGYYEYFFQRDFDRKPAILEDGNADYFSFETYAKVDKGQKLMTYHKSVRGVMGRNVYGDPIEVKEVIDLPKYEGQGFHIAEDGRTYIADITGKVEIVEGRLMVTPIHEVSGDVSLATGNIEFDGDVIVHGKVRNGMKVEATGSIIVDDILESASVVAGKDVILRSGALGNKIGTVTAKGSVFGKFFETMDIHAEGSIYCNYSLQSNLHAMESVVITGEKGSVIGGTTYGLESVVCMNIGNDKCTKTIIRSGTTPDVVVGYYESMEAIERLNETIAELENKIRSANASIIGDIQEELSEAKKRQDQYQTKMEESLKIMKKAEEAKIIGYRDIFPGTIIEISTEVFDIANKRYNVLFYLDEYIHESEPREIITFR